MIRFVKRHLKKLVLANMCVLSLLIVITEKSSKKEKEKSDKFSQHHRYSLDEQQLAHGILKINAIILKLIYRL